MADRQSFLAPSFKGQSIEELRREMQFQLQQVLNRLDTLAGKRGEPEFFADISLQENRIMNLGMPAKGSDAQRVDLSLGRSSSTANFDAEGAKIVGLNAGDIGSDAVNLDQLVDRIGGSLAGSAATSAPPEIADNSVLGAVSSRFAREDHTHGSLTVQEFLRRYSLLVC